MKFRLNNKYVRFGVTAFLVIAAGITFFYLVFHGANIRAGVDVITDILMPVVVGMAIAYLLTPVLNFVEKKLLRLADRLHIKEGKRRNSLVRGLGILITAFLFVALIYLLVYMLISQIVPSVQNIVSNFDAYTTNFTKWLNQTMEDNPEVRSYLIRTFDKYSNELENWITEILPNTAQLIKTVSLSILGVISVLWDFVIGFIISIYVLASKEKFAAQSKKLCYALFERDTANTVIRNFRFTHRTFIGFLGGKIVDSIIIGILCFIGTSILKTPYAALVSVVVGVTNVIPFFGPFLGAVPCALLIFVVDPLHPLNCLYFVIFIIILQQIDGNIIGPKILGSSTGLAGFWVIFAITLFGGLFGVFGMIIGVPIFAVIYAGIKAGADILLRKKGMPTELATYEKLDYMDDEGVHVLPEEERKASGQGAASAGKKAAGGKREHTKADADDASADLYDK